MFTFSEQVLCCYADLLSHFMVLLVNDRSEHNKTAFTNALIEADEADLVLNT